MPLCNWLSAKDVRSHLSPLLTDPHLRNVSQRRPVPLQNPVRTKRPTSSGPTLYNVSDLKAVLSAVAVDGSLTVFGQRYVDYLVAGREFGFESSVLKRWRDEKCPPLGRRLASVESFAKTTRGLRRQSFFSFEDLQEIAEARSHALNPSEDFLPARELAKKLGCRPEAISYWARTPQSALGNKTLASHQELRVRGKRTIEIPVYSVSEAQTIRECGLDSSTRMLSAAEVHREFGIYKELLNMWRRNNFCPVLGRAISCEQRLRRSPNSQRTVMMFHYSRDDLEEIVRRRNVEAISQDPIDDSITMIDASRRFPFTYEILGRWRRSGCPLIGGRTLTSWNERRWGRGAWRNYVVLRQSELEQLQQIREAKSSEYISLRQADREFKKRPGYFKNLLRGNAAQRLGIKSEKGTITHRNGAVSTGWLISRDDILRVFSDDCQSAMVEKWNNDRAWLTVAEAIDTYQLKFDALHFWAKHETRYLDGRTLRREKQKRWVAVNRTGCDFGMLRSVWVYSRVDLERIAKRLGNRSPTARQSSGAIAAELKTSVSLPSSGRTERAPLKLAPSGDYVNTPPRLMPSLEKVNELLKEFVLNDRYEEVFHEADTALSRFLNSGPKKNTKLHRVEWACRETFRHISDFMESMVWNADDGLSTQKNSKRGRPTRTMTGVDKRIAELIDTGRFHRKPAELAREAGAIDPHGEPDVERVRRVRESQKKRRQRTGT